MVMILEQISCYGGPPSTQYDSSIPSTYKSKKFIKGDVSDSSSIQPTTLGFQEQEAYIQDTSGVTMSCAGPSKPNSQTTDISQGAISKEIYDVLERMAAELSIENLLTKEQTGVPVLQTLVYHDYARNMNAGTRRRTT